VNYAGGAIINFGSWVGPIGTYSPAYAVAKCGIAAPTKPLAWCCSARGMRANAIAPGVVRTERSIKRWENNGSMLAEKPPPAAQARIAIQKTYAFSLGEPLDMAASALFLASDEARMIIGEMIAADGRSCSYLRVYVEDE